MKIFERTYLDGNPREKDHQREKHPTIEKPDVPQKCSCFLDPDPAMDIQEICEMEIPDSSGEIIKKVQEGRQKNAKSAPKATKSKAKKVHSKSDKAAGKKI